MTKKDIAFIVGYFPTISETFIVNQINSLMDEGINVHLHAYNEVPLKKIHDSFKRYNLLQKVHYFSKPPVSKLARIGVFLQWTTKHFMKIRWDVFFRTLNIFKYGKEAYSLKLFFEAQWFMLPYDFSIVHAHFGMYGNRIAYLKKLGILPNDLQLITTFHGYDLVPSKLEEYRKSYESLLRESAAFTVNTPYLEGLLQKINQHQKPIYVLPVGLDINYFQRRSRKQSHATFDLVFCGKLISLKGPDLALEIVQQLHEMGYHQVRLHLMGEGKLRDQLETQARSCKMDRFVTFYGAQSQEDIRNRFEQSDVLIMPGRYEPGTGRAETQGLVIQEAQAMELPVIVSNVGGMPYGLIPNETGYVVPEGDIDEFVKVIRKLITFPHLKNELGKKGRKFVERYEMRVLGKQLLDIYNGMN